MKKSKKNLITLFASIIMLLVSGTTVLASNNTDVIISEWKETEKGWKAIDTNGNYITRGWAKTNNNVWYYFQSEYMLSNAFVTYAGEKYYLGEDGAMHTGWLLFDEDKSVMYNTISFDNVANAFNILSIGQSKSIPFSNDNNKSYKKLWFYFNQDGSMAQDEWINVDDLWYYMDGPVCLINEWSVDLPISNNSTTTTKYGFSGNGNMHIGWIKTTKKDALSNKNDAPYSDEKTIEDIWTYYNKNGQQVDTGWEKINANWFYFINDDTYGTIMLTNTLLNVDTYNFYLDKDGYMSTKDIILYSKNKDIKINYKEINDNKITTSSAITIKKDTKTNLLFEENGIQIIGLKDNEYYFNPADKESIFILNNEFISANEITTSKMDLSNVIVGKKINNEFFYIDNENNIYYFKNGKMLKNTIITFMNVIIPINKEGHIVNLKPDSSIIIDGKKYIINKDNAKIYIGEHLINGIMIKK